METYSNKADTLEVGLEYLRIADVIVGHNIIGFDIPAIQQLYPEWKPEGLVRDTLLLSRLFYTNLKEVDSRKGWVDKKLVGSHSLKAWGQRLKCAKDDFGGTEGAFGEWSRALETYCEQDVYVTSHLTTHLYDNFQCDIEAVQLEHDFAEIIRKQERCGFKFDFSGGTALHCMLLAKKLEIEGQLYGLFPSRMEELKTPEYYVDPTDNQHYDRKGDAPAAIRKRLVDGPKRVREHPFNPRSRDQIATGLINKYNWKPNEFTPEGKPKVDEAVLKYLNYPEAKVLSEYLMISKRLGQLAEGSQAWMKVEEDGRIHGRVNTNGAVTGRCTHSNPNVAQVPSSHAPYGEECRSLFTVGDGYKLVGVDASGLELRCLAHYMGQYDGGEYARTILEGDIHTKNQEAAGLPNRNQAKTFIYGFLYGAGDAKIGEIVGGSRAEGKRLKDRFLRATPALGKLKSNLDRALESRSNLTGIDGRPIYIRSKHSALNALLQSAGAVVMKKATVLAHRMLHIAGIQANQVAHIHDEIQYEVATADAEKVGRYVCKAIQQSGEFFNFRCPLDGDYKVGDNWSETH